MVRSKLPKFCYRTGLVTFCWIRNNYRGLAIYPISLIHLSAIYISTILECWKKCTDNCIGISKYQTVTHIGQVSGHQETPSIVYGSMNVSTEMGHHQWMLKVNRYIKKLTIGFVDIGYVTNYYLIFYQEEANKSFSLKALKIENGSEKRIVATPVEKERLVNGDIIVIRIIGTKFCISVVNGKCRWRVFIDIVDGIYKLYTGLFCFGDSVTLMGYKQMDHDVPKCVGCGQIMESNWKCCLKCGKKV